MYPLRGSPGFVSGPDIGIEPIAERQAEAVGERESFTPCPSSGRPFSVCHGYGLDLYSIADQQ
jgi:hypothetical protein